MIQDDDLQPQKKPKNLETLSVTELKDYIADLRREIARAESIISHKESHKTAADALFKINREN